MKDFVVCIDGPAASGKTSVSRELAARLGCQWVSTGAFYRGLAFVAVQKEVNLEDEAALSELARNQELWSVRMSAGQTDVLFQGKVITDQLNDERVGFAASKISHFPKVRADLLPMQRASKLVGIGLVAEGRDCGTVVFPSAEVKFYLTANQLDRAQRRASELGVSTEETVRAQSLRDQQDSSRRTAPLVVAEDAVILDTTQMSFPQVVAEVERVTRARLQP